MQDLLAFREKKTLRALSRTVLWLGGGEGHGMPINGTLGQGLQCCGNPGLPQCLPLDTESNSSLSEVK